MTSIVLNNNTLKRRELALLLVILLISARVTAQSIAPTVNLPKGVISIKTIFSSINRSTGFSICYERGTIDLDRRIYSKGEHLSLDKLMDMIISQMEIELVVTSKTIFIKKKSKIHRQLLAEADSL